LKYRPNYYLKNKENLAIKNLITKYFNLLKLLKYLVQENFISQNWLNLVHILYNYNFFYGMWRTRNTTSASR